MAKKSQKAMAEERARRSRAARRIWAKRHLDRAIRELTEWLGHPPKSLVLWAEDYDNLSNWPDDIEVRRGPPRSPPPQAHDWY